MAFFTTRVELHDAKTAEDYEKLHTEMAKDGFERTVQKTGEPAYHLPTAEYNLNSEKNSSLVLDLAKKAATRTGKKFSVLVTKVDGSREWYNLKPVK